MRKPATSGNRNPGAGNRPMNDLQVPAGSSATVLKDVYIPFEDIVMDILSLLPLKTLIRFKSVSRLWNAVIPNSLRLHQQISLLCAYRIKPPEPQLWPHPKRAISISLNLLQTESDGEVASRVICSAGEAGVMLLGYPSTPVSPDYCLWNPLTRQIRQLPDPYECTGSNLGSQKFNTYGVGLDPVCNDIKVVLISARRRVSSMVLVFTLGSGCWKEVQGGFPFHNRLYDDHDIRFIYYDDHDISFTDPTYFRGSCYWLVSGRCRRDVHVVAFDLGTDSFRLINCDFIPPYHFVDRKIMSKKLFVYRDSIAVFTEQRDRSVHVWQLMSSGLGSDWSWTRCSVLGPSVESLNLWTCLKDDWLVADRVKNPPSAYGDRRVQSMTANHQLVLVDVAGGAQEVGQVLIPSCFRVDRVFTYKESLVSLS